MTRRCWICHKVFTVYYSNHECRQLFCSNQEEVNFSRLAIVAATSDYLCISRLMLGRLMAQRGKVSGETPVSFYYTHSKMYQPCIIQEICACQSTSWLPLSLLSLNASHHHDYLYYCCHLMPVTIMTTINNCCHLMPVNIMTILDHCCHIMPVNIMTILDHYCHIMLSYNASQHHDYPSSLLSSNASQHHDYPWSLLSSNAS